MPYDHFSLPVTEVATRCKVTIGMISDRATDQGNWRGLRLAANELNEHCAGEKKTRYKGGSITAGNKDQILIRLTWIGSELERNETALDLTDLLE